MAVARSLLGDHAVLVLDEPTAHLDTATAEALAHEVLDAPDRSVLWITHARAGLDLVDRVVALRSATDAAAAPARTSAPVADRVPAAR
jgi:ATP-binding cassette subfamily C protein CydCD